MDTILIYTDGSSRGNPGPGGWGAVVAQGDFVQELGGYEAHTTNNRMELLAVFEALSFAATLPELPIIVRSDSTYVINGATQWHTGWHRRGWKTQDNKDVSNRDLWEPTLALLKSISHRLTWENVGGHMNIPGNERADTIATTFALEKKMNVYQGLRSNYDIDLVQVTYNPTLKKQKTESRTRSKAKAYSYVSVVDKVIMVHKTWDECKKRVEGKKARYKKALSAEEEARIVEEFS